MQYPKIPLTLVILTMLIAVTCSRSSESPEEKHAFRHAGEQVADGIIYDVEILNPDPGNQWIEECLEGLDREALIEWVFEGIYAERFKIYDIFEGTEIRVSEVRQMEAEGAFTRDEIGKFQFVEAWYTDPLNFTMSKRVTEIRMGTRYFDADGFIRGYNPLFRVVLD